MKPVIILKIGGSLIAPKDSKKPKINRKNLRRICREIGAAYTKIRSRKAIVIVHGAGNYGHLIVSRTGIHKGLKSKQNLIDFAETQRLQNLLNTEVTKELIKNGIPAFPFQSSDHVLMKGGRIERFSTEIIEELIKIGMVPVAFGVPAYDLKQGCSILSGDEIAPHLAKKLKAERIIHATDVDGVFTSDPKKAYRAKLIRKITRKNFSKIQKSLSGSAFVDVTGGMMFKVRQMLSIHVKAQILNGKKNNVIKNAILGKTREGTEVTF